MIRLVLTDLDGTLITSKREITQSTKRAVDALREAGINFTLVSGRPPLGMRPIAQSLAVKTPFAAFNGGMIINPDFSVLEQYNLEPDIAVTMIRKLEEWGLDVWVYRKQEWLIRYPNAPHVARERDTVQFSPVVVDSIESNLNDVTKIVGVSDDYSLVEKAENALQSDRCQVVMAARSQNYYLDITHREANKGSVVQRLAKILRISPAEIATLGDMPSDVAMFSQSRISFAMGNASNDVKSKASHVVASNDSDGFAEAVRKILLQ